MSSSETAAGVSTPRSVNSSEMYPAVTAHEYTLHGVGMPGSVHSSDWDNLQGCPSATPSLACNLLQGRAYRCTCTAAGNRGDG